MVRIVFALAAIATVIGTQLVAPLTGHSQQPAAALELTWDVAPVGLLADTRLRDAIGQLVDPAAVMKQAGVAGTLRYGGSPPSPRPDQVRLLFAAAGFDNPAAQMGQQRRCRIWITATFVDSQQRGRVMAELGIAIANGLRSLGIQVEPCDGAASLAEADIVLWSSGQTPPLPPNTFRTDEASFLIALPRPGPQSGGPGAVTPPITGDGGLK